MFLTNCLLPKGFQERGMRRQFKITDRSVPADQRKVIWCISFTAGIQKIIFSDSRKPYVVFGYGSVHLQYIEAVDIILFSKKEIVPRIILHCGKPL